MKIPASIKSKEARKICKDVTGNWELDESMIVLLTVALQSYQRMQDAKRILDKVGVIIKTPSGQIKKNPAAEVEKTSRAGFLIAWRMLNLGVELPGPIGKPGGGGYSIKPPS